MSAKSLYGMQALRKEKPWNQPFGTAEMRGKYERSIRANQ